MFKGNKKAIKIRDWIEEFQKKVNKSAGNQHLKFTAEIWTKEKNSPTPAKEEIFQIVTNDELTFLDMQMSWSPKGDL